MQRTIEQTIKMLAAGLKKIADGNPDETLSIEVRGPLVSTRLRVWPDGAVSVALLPTVELTHADGAPVRLGDVLTADDALYLLRAALNYWPKLPATTITVERKPIPCPARKHGGWCCAGTGRNEQVMVWEVVADDEPDLTVIRGGIRAGKP